MFNNVIWGYSFGKKFQMWNAGAVSLALHSLRRMAGNSSGHAAELKLSSIMASMMSTSLNSINTRDRVIIFHTYIHMEH